MKRLHAYIIKSFIGPFILTFFICVFILLMQFLWKYLDELVGKGLENSIIIELMSYAAVSLIPMALPLSVLLASIMAFGNLGERFELLAMKASGISLLRIMRPLIIINIAITILAFFMSNNLVPTTNAKFAALLWSVKSQRPEMIIKEGIFTNEIDGYSIKVSGKDQKTKALLDLMIYDHTEGKGNTSVTLADSGYINMSDDKQFIVLTLYNGENYQDIKSSGSRAKKTYPFSRQKFEKQEMVISVKNFDLKRHDEKYFRDNYKMLNNKQLNIFIDSLSNIYTEREKLVITGIRYNEILNNQILDKISPDSTTNDTTAAQLYPTHIDSIINNLRADRRLTVLTTAHRNAHQNQRVILQYQNDLYSRMIWINKHVVELHKKYSLSLACLLFFFIGAPLGAIIRKGGFGMPVVVSILLFMLYYLISAISEKVAREGVWEMSLILWLPTALFIAIGISLTHQAVTDSLILNKEAYNIFISKINFVKFLKSKKKKK